MTDDRGQKTEVRRQRTEDRGQRAEDRSQRAEVRGQKSEDRRQRAEGIEGGIGNELKSEIGMRKGEI